MFPGQQRRAIPKQQHQALNVRTHTCLVCNVIGQHLESNCPSKHLVGLPEVKRRLLREQAEAVFYEGVCHPALVDAQAAKDIIRKRADVPGCLRCYMCTYLCENAVWCSRCGTMACSACLAPPDCQWVCAKCFTADDEAFHVVGPFRDMCEHWTMIATIQADMQTINKPFVPEATTAAAATDHQPPESTALLKRRRK